MVKITRRIVEAAEAREKDYLIRGDELTGFGVRVSSSGKRSYVIQYPIRGRSRRYTIGLHGAWSPETARFGAARRRHAESPVRTSHDLRPLKRILDHFEARLAEDIRLADLASDCGLSESYLARAFRAATGTTLHTALVERRIARARSLIGAASRRGAPASLAEAAAATGFSSHAHMTTAFRRVLGITPSEWMRMFVDPSRHGPTDHTTAS